MFLDDGDRSTVKFSDCRAPSDEIMIVSNLFSPEFVPMVRVIFLLNDTSELLQKYPIFGAVFECSTSKPVPEKLPFESGDLNNEVYFESVIIFYISKPFEPCEIFCQQLQKIFLGKRNRPWLERETICMQGKGEAILLE